MRALEHDSFSSSETDGTHEMSFSVLPDIVRNEQVYITFCKRIFLLDRLCGLVVSILGYRSGGPGSIPGTTKKSVVGLERGPLNLVSTTEELLDRKVAAPV
jgi:hypothetical protein